MIKRINLNPSKLNLSQKALIGYQNKSFSTIVNQRQQEQQEQQNDNNQKDNNNNFKFKSVLVGGICLASILTTSVILAEDENKQTWREKIINNYQNRIREFSTPEKVFQIFASVRKNGQSYMTVEDFIRAILPHQYKASSDTSTKPKSVNIKDIPYSFKIADVDGDGLISFSEFMFFSTLLSIPENSAPIAFKVMDINGDGSVDINEFISIIKILSHQSPFAMNATTSPNTAPFTSKGSLSFLFGKNGEKRLTGAQFQQFLSQLRRDVLHLEFNFYDPKSTGVISQRDFGLLLISYCKLGQMKQHMGALSSLPSTVDSQNKGITFEQFVSFNKLLDKLPDVELSMDLYKGSNQPFNKSQFKYVSKIITNEEPAPQVVNTVYTIFDTDKNGDLAKDEFVELMERRKYRGLNSNRDTGFIEKLKKIYKILINQE
ncbi:hypothetical protein DICPUDRAFT_158565 [Dictyostelium purpureum]|uniref:EF-hand domain-containing protein n=1 Tax=Dictyostelium purpureum TaxID=5786 RepID=F1A1X2_DICPU|nr:uncharacterized protein DICPUDRAFT_158565 [Dictyostelium purpureum]EGC29805.1 hypothetical protein DICPUDRAFT_158565 [Dictyostelium purpureum]|eukprot:XP_003293670.1 hypothetical protein DICPUDRAFT_158565 [Dictyostelium purpureum]